MKKALLALLICSLFFLTTIPQDSEGAIFFNGTTYAVSTTTFTNDNPYGMTVGFEFIKLSNADISSNGRLLQIGTYCWFDLVGTANNYQISYFIKKDAGTYWSGQLSYVYHSGAVYSFVMTTDYDNWKIWVDNVVVQTITGMMPWYEKNWGTATYYVGRDAAGTQYADDIALRDLNLNNSGVLDALIPTFIGNCGSYTFAGITSGHIADASGKNKHLTLTGELLTAPLALFTDSGQLESTYYVQFTDNTTWSALVSEDVYRIYSWNFDDGSYANGTYEGLPYNPLHEFPAMGFYNVTLTVTNYWGTDSYTKMITIAEIPEAGTTVDAAQFDQWVLFILIAGAAGFIVMAMTFGRRGR